MTFDTSGLVEKKNQAGTKYYENHVMEIAAKECTSCNKILKVSGFNKQKTGMAGLASACKECTRKRYIERKQKNPDFVRELRKRSREYVEKNRNNPLYWERVRKTDRKRYRAHSEIYKTRSNRYYHLKQKNCQKYKENRKEYNAQYRRKNIDELLKKEAEYREINRKKIRERSRRWAMENPEKARVGVLNRRAMLRELPNNLTNKRIEEIMRNFDNKCALTESKADIHFDHVIPISSGHGGTTYENIIPLRADLNLSKDIRCIFDWFADNRDRFGLEQRKFDELIEYLADINDMTTKEYEEYVRWCHDNPRTVDEIKAEKESENDIA